MFSDAGKASLKGNYNGVRDLKPWVKTHGQYLPSSVMKNGKSSTEGMLMDSHGIQHAQKYLDEMGDPFITQIWIGADGTPRAGVPTIGEDGKIKMTSSDGAIRKLNGAHLDFLAGVEAAKREAVNALIRRVGCSNEALAMLCDIPVPQLKLILDAAVAWPTAAKTVAGVSISAETWGEIKPDAEAIAVSGMPSALIMYPDGSAKQKACICKLRAFLTAIAPHVDIMSTKKVEKESSDVEKGVSQSGLPAAT